MQDTQGTSNPVDVGERGEEVLWPYGPWLVSVGAITSVIESFINCGLAARNGEFAIFEIW